MSQGEKDCEGSLTSTISAKLYEGAQKAESLFLSACIYRVPEKLRKLNASAYTPQLIAIGPLHQNDKYLQTPMQQVKMSYANHLLCRLTKGVEDRELARCSLLQECVAEIKLSIDYAKKCYAEEVRLDVEMILVDGCFILELLYRNFEFCWFFYNIDSSHPVVGSDNGYSEETTTTSTELLSVLESRVEVERSRTIEEILDLRRADPIFGNEWTAVAVHHDLLLLENQIPFSVLEKLFLLTVDRIPIGTNRLSLTGYLFRYFGKKMRPEVPSRPANDHYHHILHKVHDGYLPPDHTGKTELNKMMPSATELVYSGVKFELGTGDDLFKVKFTESEGPFWLCRRARFEIPKLVIEDLTESSLRNLIAFEQCCPGVPQHFTSYAILMDMLVDSDKDVQVLEKAGVVRNCLGASEDAANLFNKLCKEIVLGEFFFADICDRAHDYRRSFWPKNNAHVRRQYFASPWRFIAFCLAFCAVAISITQFLRSFRWP